VTLLENIRSQPQHLARLAEEWRCRVLPPLSPPFVFTGMGSSLFAAYPGYLRLCRAGVPAQLWETAELLHYGAVPEHATVILISQSGGTAEVLALRERLGPGHTVVAVTNEPESALARAAQQVILLGTASQSLATTVTYTATLFVVEALAHLLAGEAMDGWIEEVGRAAQAMPAYLAALQTSDLPVPAPGGHLVLLARGPSLATAQQGALMFKEVAGRGGEALSAAAFRHGPLEMAGPEVQALLFLAHGPTAPLTMRLAQDLVGFGVRVLRIGDERLVAGGHPPVSEAVAPFFNILPVQLAAERMAHAAAREPGVFRQASSVTTDE
jgi:glucosamine--fructose-6-phosphate aminotransferase (isomerizing)